MFQKDTAANISSKVRTYKIIVGKSELLDLLWRPGCRWEDSVALNLYRP
jgi:hypothetical protein